jgi:predicted RecB family nuclease
MVSTSKVTREVLDSYLRCKTKGFLTLTGRDGIKSDYDRWRIETEERQRVGATANLLLRYRGYQVADGVNLHASRLRAGVDDLILHGRFENALISMNIDALVKAEPLETPGQGHYIPVLFHDGAVLSPEKALIELFALLVSELQESVPDVGLVCRSQGKPTTLRFTPGLAAARKLLADISKLHQGLQPPMLVLNTHCQICEYREHCHKQAVEDDNLSLISGMNEVQIQRLNRKGIFTKNQLSYTFRLRRKPKRAKISSPTHHFPLRALALRETKVFVHGSLTVTYPAGTRIYLDIEGTPQSHSYYLIGAVTSSHGHEQRDTFWSDTSNEPDQVRMFVDFLDHLGRYPDYCLLHFGKYEPIALRRIRACVTHPYKRQIDDALARSIDILNVIGSRIYFPTYSNSLKEIGGFLGYRWSGPLSSGLQTLVWRDRWLTDHDPFLKAALIQYNYEDCSALKGVAEFLEKVGAASFSSSSQDRPGLQVASTSSLGTENNEWHRYGQTDYVLEEFQTINRLAYFDYQRDRVFARTQRNYIRSRGRQKRLSLKPNKIITLRAAKCPVCHSRNIEAVTQASHEIIDLKFMSAGNKRWITRFASWRYRCDRCGSRFVPISFQRWRKMPKYGRGVISWCIYQLLVGGQNLNRIQRSLLDLFGLRLPNTMVYLFKGAVAEYFKTGYEKILKDLLRGRLIHIDETTVNLQKDKGYVWVLASTESVYFFYRTSREGSFLADMLQRFKGVLVSDFYTAYDALDMPQQRCLIHLMRDMNDDLLKHPFDDELKSIASKFSSLLKDIVNAIDRYGLKRRHLNKYRIRAERFCDWVINQPFKSDSSKTYVRRIAKYRRFMFAFLAYDGIPWNNNNAERAIKSFAKFRRFSNGLATEQTIREYLILLSIYLTCEYRGIDFLKVLRGDTKGDCGFGPKRGISLRLRPQRLGAGESEPRAGVRQSEGNPCSKEQGGPSVVDLNKLLPAMLEKLGHSFGGFRPRTELARDLWPVRIDSTELEVLLRLIIHNFMKKARTRAAIFSARNLRLDKPEPATGLKGRYVAVSFSDGGRRVEPRGGDVEADAYLDQVDALAKEFGGTATVISASTGRNVAKTIVTIYIPQYSSKQDARANPRAARMIATH